MALVDVSNPDKLIFERAGLTKSDLVEHYSTVAERMLAFMADRPLTLQRFPNGIESKGFMQKNASDHFPETIGRFEVPKNDGGVTTYPVVTGAEDVAYLANQGTITFHMWLTTTAHPDAPDWLVMDLDPEDGDLAGVRSAAHVIRSLLAGFNIEGFPIATGSSGFHVWVPLGGGHTGEDVVMSARALAGLAATQRAEGLTTEFLKKNRKGRVFVDWLRNVPGATTVVPFSLRPRPTAPVAVPLIWDEIDEVRPDSWTLGTLGDRMELPVDVAPQVLPVSDIVQQARAEGVDLDSGFDRFGRK